MTQVASLPLERNQWGKLLDEEGELLLDDKLDGLLAELGLELELLLELDELKLDDELEELVISWVLELELELDELDDDDEEELELDELDDDVEDALDSEDEDELEVELDDVLELELELVSLTGSSGVFVGCILTQMFDAGYPDVTAP